MKVVCLSIFLSFFVGSSLAQYLKGYVTIQNSGKPLYPAIVRSADAGDAKTDSHTGEFMLKYESKRSGEDVFNTEYRMEIL